MISLSLTQTLTSVRLQLLYRRVTKIMYLSYDDVGYITQVIPPRIRKPESSTIEFSSIDVSKTTSVGDTSRLYLYEETNIDEPPLTTVQGYRFGARNNDTIGIIPDGGVSKEYRANIVMPNTVYTTKKAKVKKLKELVDKYLLVIVFAK